MSAAPTAACRRCGVSEPRTFTVPVVDCSGRLLVATSAICACGGTTLVGLRPARTADGRDARGR
ncbi:hypothetical protein [Streptomyces monomycini]|uniref:hypothetical protein n=1 Tax=Streptomyces monomycini TaxID=371720 RepID=UPI0004AA767A|nr:hypothetical protein [Streptomyces monomycini]